MCLTNLTTLVKRNVK